MGAILEQDGYSGRRPRAAIREHPGPGGRCQVPPRRTTNLAHRNTYLLTNCYSISWLCRVEYSGGEAASRTHLGTATCHPNACSGTHTCRQATCTHTHKHTTYTSRKQVPSVDKLPLLRVRRSLTWDQASRGEIGGPACQHTTPWYSAQPCSVSQVSLFSRLSARGHRDGWTWNVKSKVRLKMG